MYLATGAYILQLTIRDFANNTGTTERIITVSDPNLPPVALLSVSKFIGKSPFFVKFDPSDSFHAVGSALTLYEYDFGTQFDYEDLSGVITIQPPPIRQVLPTLVPTVDVDGNETSGVASVLHQVPLGTYTGWNVNAGGFYKGDIRSNAGGYIPFARTRAERLAAGDPRPSLEERYGTHENYVARVRAAADRLVRGRYLLKDDAERLVAEADASEVLK